MTTEKAIEILSGFGIINRYCAEDAEVLDMAIKALEQQSCEDCISREAVKETIFVQGSAEILEIDFAKLLLLQRAIKALPSVTPKPKIGRWIEQEGFDGDTYYDCSECGESFCLIDGTPTDNLYNYCPNCGARMIESEDKR